MNKTIIVLITIILLVEGKRHYIENKMHKKQQELAGGIRWESPQNFHNDEDYKKAVQKAMHEFHGVCHVSIEVSWIRVEKVGFQIVAGVMWWLEVELSNNEVYEMKVLQELEGTFELVGCTQ